MDLPQSNDIDSTTDNWNKNTFNEPPTTYEHINETPSINATNPNYHPISSTTPTTPSWETHSPVVDKAKTELKKGQQQAEDIITKTKRAIKQHCKLNRSKLPNVFKCP
jgi:hypothetical protein